MGLCCTLGISRFDFMPKKNCVKKTDKFRTFWTISAKELHYAKGDSKNKENINESLGFIVLLASIRGSRNKQIILDSHYSESYLLLINPFLTMLSRSRWLEIGPVPFSGVFTDLDFV